MIEKILERFREKFKYNSEQAEIYREGSYKDAYFREKKDLYLDRANTYGEAIRIVQEVAKEYDAFDVIYKKACELENEYANKEDWENVNSCIRLENLLQYFKEQLKAPYQKGE